MGRGLGKLQRCMLETLNNDRLTFHREDFYLEIQIAYYEIAIWTDLDGSHYGLDNWGKRFDLINAEDELNRRRASMSQTMRSLIQQGLVEKHKMQLYGFVTITDKGKEALSIK